ncbi:Hypothetical protein NCS54_00625900 [Fusarium falciforme]|uniref:Hypothetical protein n=1 Tax=Fusarium falciforme TaxID=195108 RepID=UPI002300E946|nr:Hypothetical protein NCS54_00625900 [Fusarium falciforme]WAO88892.1 Hypothetical protein NCS54_00625900 [Fusarium falciforme]
MAGLTFSHPLILLALLLAFSQFLEAVDFSRPRQPKGDLKVRLDYALATDGGRTKRDKREGPHKWVFSTYLVFNEPVSSITSGQLRQIASDAIDEMSEDIMQYKPEDDDRTGRPRRLPGVMTIMAFDNEIILASSQKGSVAFLSRYPDNPDVWGCNLLIKHANIDVDYFQDDVQAEPYNLDEIAGGIKRIGQIQMHPCNDNKKVLWSVRNGN